MVTAYITYKEHPVLTCILAMKTVNLRFFVEFKNQSNEQISLLMASDGVEDIKNDGATENDVKMKFFTHIGYNSTDVIIKTLVNGKTVAMRRLL